MTKSAYIYDNNFETAFRREQMSDLCRHYVEIRGDAEHVVGRYRERKKWIEENCRGKYECVLGKDYYFEILNEALMFKMTCG